MYAGILRLILSLCTLVCGHVSITYRRIAICFEVNAFCALERAGIWAGMACDRSGKIRPYKRWILRRKVQIVHIFVSHIRGC
jgi:hypothetical protein